MNEIPLRAVLRTGEPIKDFEGTVLFRDGSQKVVLGNATPLATNNSSISGAIAVFTIRKALMAHSLAGFYYRHSEL